MTWWGEKEPCSEIIMGRVEDGTEGEMIIGAWQPDWVRLPEEIDIDGGLAVSVLGTKQEPCPIRDCNLIVSHLVLDDGYGVAECPVHKCVWYRKREPKPEEET